MTAPMLSLPSMHTARFLVYEIPISQPSAPSRFFMASTPTLAPRQKGNWRNRQEVSLAKWLVEDGAAHGQRSGLFKQVRFSGHDLRARAADRLYDTIGGIIGTLAERPILPRASQRAPCRALPRTKLAEKSVVRPRVNEGLAQTFPPQRHKEAYWLCEPLAAGDSVLGCGVSGATFWPPLTPTRTSRTVRAAATMAKVKIDLAPPLEPSSASIL